MKFSVFTNEQELLKAIIEIHCPLGIHCDPMYFKGNFYKEIPQPFHRSDLNPLEGIDCSMADAKELPYENNYLNSIILDPPFMFGIHGKTKGYYSSRTHGIFKDILALETLYKGILGEAYRVLKKKGILIFKCQDYTDNKTTMTHCLVWNWAKELGFYPKDLAILNIQRGKIYNPSLIQRHLRKVHSYFWVFEKLTK